jgi:RNA polymerase sigma-70 factor (ECF subfamily)
MIDAQTRDDWSLLSAKLRPFIAKRVEPTATNDVLQDVFLRMHRGLPNLQDEERFGTWVYQIARSAIAEHHRLRAKHPLLPGSDSLNATSADAQTSLVHNYPPNAEELSNPMESEDDRAASRELSSCVTLFVARLPSPYREAITLTELEGLSQKEAAEMLSISLAAMKSRVLRGRAKLREMMETCCQIALDARGKVLSYEPRPATAANCCPQPLTQIGKSRPPPDIER